MYSSEEYQLLDFGSGRKLERFGPYLLDRPAPAAATAPRRQPELWAEADARYERGEEARGRWYFNHPVDAVWPVGFGPLTLELKLTEFGHLGVFPEQIDNWAWIDAMVRAAGPSPKVLNLFAYTGGSTLAAARAGAEVVHVDSAENVVAWARRNAQASGLVETPIRWLVEDVLKFVGREVRRGRRYNAVILDPPAYGHGPHGEAWKIDEHLDALLDMCGELTRDQRQFVLMTCHSGRLATADGLTDYVRKREAAAQQGVQIGGREMTIVSVSGDRLNAGAAVRLRDARRLRAAETS